MDCKTTYPGKQHQMECLTGREAAEYSQSMKHTLLLLSLLVVVGGCNGAATRAWQNADMPSRDAERVFEAARDVLSKHFEVDKANWVAGTIVTKPQLFDRKRSGTLADVRGAGGRWRRTASFEFTRDDLTVVAHVAVREEREGTAAAMAISDATTGERSDELPRTGPQYNKTRVKKAEDVWVEVGYDKQMARELLQEIAEHVRRAEQGEAMPKEQSPRDLMEETRRMGRELQK